MEEDSPAKQPIRRYCPEGRRASTGIASPSNNSRISEETRERIKSIALDMGYHQNPLVTANVSADSEARQQRTKPTVGLLSTWVEEAEELKRVEWHIQSRFLEGERRSAEDSLSTI